MNQSQSLAQIRWKLIQPHLTLALGLQMPLALALRLIVLLLKTKALRQAVITLLRTRLIIINRLTQLAYLTQLASIAATDLDLGTGTTGHSPTDLDLALEQLSAMKPTAGPIKT
jgi:hypothetical protein